MKIHFKGKEYDLDKDLSAFTARLDAFREESEAAVTAANAAVIAANADRDKAQARADAAEAEAKKERDSFDARLDAAVSARVSLNTSAMKVLGETYDPSGKTAREIMTDVIRADDENFTGKDAAGADRSLDYLQARFDAVLEHDVRLDSIEQAPKKHRQAREEQGGAGGQREDAWPDAEKARQEMVTSNRAACNPSETN